MEGKTAQQILDVAQDMVRSRGYSAFSYADISEQIGHGSKVTVFR